MDLSAKENIFTVSQFVATLNQILEYSVPYVRIAGEVSNFKVSQGKWVSFRLKDDDSIVECFMGAWNLRTPIEDGMTVVVAGNPRLSGKWGKFSISTQSVTPAGEGAHRRAYELLKKKLLQEGLFSAERKRSLPRFPIRIGLISSEQAAGFADFCKILQARWPLAELDFVHVAVQGQASADQVIEALELLNQRADLPEVIAIVRGGGSAEDLASFNDEPLIRAIASSRVPVVVGVGHEVDETLATLAADLAASTPSNAAELIVPDQSEVRASINMFVRQQRSSLLQEIRSARQSTTHFAQSMHRMVQSQREQVRHESYRLERSFMHAFDLMQDRVALNQRLLEQLHPKRQLVRGFAIVRKENLIVRSSKSTKAGDDIAIELTDGSISAEVQ